MLHRPLNSSCPQQALAVLPANAPRPLSSSSAGPGSAAQAADREVILKGIGRCSTGLWASNCPLQALEVLRKLQTEKAQEVKEMRLKLDHAKTIKDQAQARSRFFAPVAFLCGVNL